MLQEVMTSPGVIEFRDVPIPEIRDDQVLVKMMRLGICGSDIHVYHGKHPYTKYPVTQGHEVSGEIVQVGSAVKGLEVGQKVVLEPQVTCGKCYPCTHGKYNLCTELKVMGFQTTGAASEYFAVDASKVDVIPDSMTYDEAALIEPLTIALAAAEQAHISYGKSVAIMGAGGIGLMLVQLARLAGASCVTVFDLVEEKCELAKQLGADYAFDPRKEGALEEAMKVAGGAYDCVLEGTGVVSSAENALKLLARNGDGVYFAMYGKDPYLQVNLHTDFYWDQKHLHGVIMGAGLFPKAIKLAPRVNLKALIQKEHPLSRYQDAFADLYTKKYAKIVIKMDE